MRRCLVFSSLAVFAVALGVCGTAYADQITFQNAVVGLTVTSDNTVTVSIQNTLTNAQVQSVAQNISGRYFQVSGYTGSAVSLSSSSGQTTDIYNGTGTVQGVTSTGWVASNFGSGLTLCVVCASPVQNQTAPQMTIVGGTGSGAYPNANSSISSNGPHNPFLVGTVSFTLYVPGVTRDSTFSNVGVQFGTSATPPTVVPEPGSIALLLATGGTLFGGIVIRFRTLS
jgi:hypothetical protein